MLSRFRSAARILLKGEPKKNRRDPIPAITPEEAVMLYRPIGPEELELVAASGYRRWPARLPGQPIFYPVT